MFDKLPAIIVYYSQPLFAVCMGIVAGYLTLVIGLRITKMKKRSE